MDIFDKALAPSVLRDACAKWMIINPDDIARFLAQASVESSRFTRTRESMAYRAETLLRVCAGRNGITTLDAAAAAVSKGASGVAEALYGGAWGSTRLGNTQPGDGPRFIGRGFIQTTGRWNYHVTSQRVYGDDRLVMTPELLEVDDGAAQSACAYWMSKALNGVTDVPTITRRINGGSEALQERIDLTTQLLAYNRATP